MFDIIIKDGLVIDLAGFFEVADEGEYVF